MNGPPCVHLFRNTPAPAGDHWLSPFERNHLATLRFPKRRADWLLGRATAKATVLQHLNTNLSHSQISIQAAADGAPEVWIHGQIQPLTLSISHSGGAAFCAVTPSGTPMGCDLETVEPRSDQFIEDYFTEAQAAHILSLKGEDKALAATLHWSALESALKALRCGLRRDTRTLLVTVSEVANPLWNDFEVRDLQTEQQFTGWWRRINGFVATLSVLRS